MTTELETRTDGTEGSQTRPSETGGGPPRTDGDDDESPATDGAAVLSLLQDEHAREVLVALGGEEKPARDVVSECDASRTTVYRRLDALESAELVSSSLAIAADGHHRKVFEATLERVTVDVAGEDRGVTVTTHETDR